MACQFERIARLSGWQGVACVYHWVTGITRDVLRHNVKTSVGTVFKPKDWRLSHDHVGRADVRPNTYVLALPELFHGLERFKKSESHIIAASKQISGGR